MRLHLRYPRHALFVQVGSSRDWQRQSFLEFQEHPSAANARNTLPGLRNGYHCLNSRPTTGRINLGFAQLGPVTGSWVCRAAANNSEPSFQLSSGSGHRLLLYSKEGCCLCDGLKEKLEAVLHEAKGRPEDPLNKVQLQVRDILTKAEWTAAYQYEIPVLRWCANAEGECVEEHSIPRIPPRASVDRVRKVLLDSLALHS